MALIRALRLALAAVVLAVGYGWILFLFVLGVMLVMAGFVMLPFYIVSVPVIAEGTHRFAGVVAGHSHRSSPPPEGGHAHHLPLPHPVGA
jgi:hypothetical protein